MEINNNFMNTSYDSLYQLIDNIGIKSNQQEKIAEKVGNNLENAELAYLNAVSAKNPDPGTVAKAEMVYKRTLQVYQSFMQIMDSSFQIMRTAINRLSVH